MTPDEIEKKIHVKFLDEVSMHTDFLEDISDLEPNRSCDKVRAWMKLNIEASKCSVWNN